MRYRIKIRCYELGITLKTLWNELVKRGHTLTYPEFSLAHSTSASANAERVEKALACADEILTEWERRLNEQSNQNQL